MTNKDIIFIQQSVLPLLTKWYRLTSSIPTTRKEMEQAGILGIMLRTDQPLSTYPLSYLVQAAEWGIHDMLRREYNYTNPNAPEMVSLDEEHIDEDAGTICTLHDVTPGTAPTPEQEYIKYERDLALDTAIGQLPGLLAHTLNKVYGRNGFSARTLSKLAEEEGVSRSAITQRHERGLWALYDYLRGKGMGKLRELLV